MTQRKLYTKGKCSFCAGKHIGCPYCDRDGLAFIEASDKIIIQWILDLEEDRRKELITMMVSK